MKIEFEEGEKVIYEEVEEKIINPGFEGEEDYKIKTTISL